MRATEVPIVEDFSLSTITAGFMNRSKTPEKLAMLISTPFTTSFNLSAVSAPICLEAPAHEDPARRYTAAVANGGFYLVAALFGTSITGALNAFPDPRSGERWRVSRPCSLRPPDEARTSVGRKVQRKV